MKKLIFTFALIVVLASCHKEDFSSQGTSNDAFSEEMMSNRELESTSPNETEGSPNGLINPDDTDVSPVTDTDGNDENGITDPMRKKDKKNL